MEDVRGYLTKNKLNQTAVFFYGNQTGIREIFPLETYQKRECFVDAIFIHSIPYIFYMNLLHREQQALPTNLHSLGQQTSVSSRKPSCMLFKKLTNQVKLYVMLTNVCTPHRVVLY